MPLVYDLVHGWGGLWAHPALEKPPEFAGDGDDCRGSLSALMMLSAAAHSVT